MKPITPLLYILMLFLLLTNGCVSQSTPPAIPSPLQETLPIPDSTNTFTQEPLATFTPTELPSNILFDDFNYSDHAEMISKGWIIRSKAGWPDTPGSTFRPENVSFVDDTVVAGSGILRMTSSTDGTSVNTFQTQICHERKYLEGTYAARVYFSNEPISGPDGDQVVETFYNITPYREALDPDYSEMDFEYLPNGGWDWGPMTFMFTTWETVRIDPWLADNASNPLEENHEGWNTLVLQVKDGKVRYFVSGKLTAEHAGNYYPDSPMSINFNLWFITGGQINSQELRTYQEDIDWVFHEAGVVLTPQEVNRKVLELRGAGIRQLDTVPPVSPPLESLCDM